MRKFAIILCGVLGLSACAGDRPMSKQAYTELFAARLHQAAPQLKLEIQGELKIKITGAGGIAATAFLNNSYDSYAANPAALEQVLQEYVAGGVAAFAKTAENKPVDRNLIVPVIKDWAWLADTRKAMRERGAAEKDIPEYVSEPLNTELVIVYAEDSPQTVSYLTAKTLATAGLKKEELRALAIANLRKLLPKVEAKGSNGVYFMSAGGAYEASLLLFEDIWREKRMKVEGDYVVAVPSRETLLITGSGETEGLKKVRELAKSTAAESPYHLTADLFVYRKGKFVKLED